MNIKSSASSKEETGLQSLNFFQQQKDELHDQIKENITDIVNRAAEEVFLKKQPVQDVEEVLNELERDIEQKMTRPSIKVNADVHESLRQICDSDQDESTVKTNAITPTTLNAPDITNNEEIQTDSRIPLLAGKTSTPIKVRTIKKHSKVNRELTIKPGATIRPTVEDIEWAAGNQFIPTENTLVTTTKTTTRSSKSKIPKSKLKLVSSDNDQTDVKVISTHNLENVFDDGLSDDEHSHGDDDQEPENLIITGEVDDGDHSVLFGDDDDIDEVILVQTPGSDFTPDSDEFLAKESNNERKVTTEIIKSADGTTTQITVITEQNSANGQLAEQKQQKQENNETATKGTVGSSIPSGQENISRDTLTNTNNSISINSESDSDSRGESPYQLVRPSTGSGTNKSTAGKTLGSSSGSDVALCCSDEAGAELSDDEPGTNLSQNIETNRFWITRLPKTGSTALFIVRDNVPL